LTLNRVTIVRRAMRHGASATENQHWRRLALLAEPRPQAADVESSAAADSRSTAARRRSLKLRTSLLTSERSVDTFLSEIERSKVPKTDLLQGTLDLLILKILALGPNHGWGISSRIRQISREGLNASQGSLYPALHRLELNGDVESQMIPSENNRRARVSRLTPADKRRLGTERARWNQFALSMKRILQAD